MEKKDLSELIKVVLKYYDNQNKKYLEFIVIENININSNNNNDLNDNLFIFNSDDNREFSFNFEILGYFDNETKIWIWGWLIAELNSEKTAICRNLLNYGLKLEPNSNTLYHNIIKPLLLNSRILIEENVQLETNLAIISYLIKDNILFIYPKKHYIDKNATKFITIYYLIKKL